MRKALIDRNLKNARRKVFSVREKEGPTIAQVAERFDVGVAT